MAYTRHNFVDGEVLMAAQLNNINDGIAESYKKPESGIPAEDIATDAVTSTKIKNGAVSTAYSISIATGNWSGSTAPYTATISVDGVTAEDKPIWYLVPSNTYSTAASQVNAFRYLYRLTAADGSVTVYASTKPSVALPIQFICVRK